MRTKEDGCLLLGEERRCWLAFACFVLATDQAKASPPRLFLHHKATPLFLSFSYTYTCTPCPWARGHGVNAFSRQALLVPSSSPMLVSSPPNGIKPRHATAPALTPHTFRLYTHVHSSVDTSVQVCGFISTAWVIAISPSCHTDHPHHEEEVIDATHATHADRFIVLPPTTPPRPHAASKHHH